MNIYSFADYILDYLWHVFQVYVVYLGANRLKNAALASNHHLHLLSKVFTRLPSSKLIFFFFFEPKLISLTVLFSSRSIISSANIWRCCCSKEDATQSMLYSYNNGFSGFSAKLNASQATSLASNTSIFTLWRQNYSHL